MCRSFRDRLPPALKQTRDKSNHRWFPQRLLVGIRHITDHGESCELYPVRLYRANGCSFGREDHLGLLDPSYEIGSQLRCLPCGYSRCPRPSPQLSGTCLLLQGVLTVVNRPAFLNYSQMKTIHHKWDNVLFQERKDYT